MHKLIPLFKQNSMVLGGILMLAFCLPTQVHAATPDIKIQVLNGVTGAPIVGVVVKQTNTTDLGFGTCRLSPAEQSSRYEPTDSAGHALFSGDYDNASQLWKATTPLDIDLDGVQDTTYIKFVSGIDSVTGNPCSYLADYGCGQNPHYFEVVKPIGWTGTFTEIQPNPISFNNIAGEFTFTSYYYPGTPPVTSTNTNWCDPNCSTKDVGVYDPISGVFTPTNIIDYSKAFVIRLKINNQSAGTNKYVSTNLGRVIINEEVLGNLYNLVDPGTATNLVITRQSPTDSAPVDVTNAVCPSGGSFGRTCITNNEIYVVSGKLTKTQLTFNNVNSNDTYFIYLRFQINPATPDYMNRYNFINNDLDSNISYVDQSKVLSLGNKQLFVRSSVSVTPPPTTPPVQGSLKNCAENGTDTCAFTEIGTFNPLGNYTPEMSTLKGETDYWLKMTLIGQNKLNPTKTAVVIDKSRIELREILNDSSFYFYEPQYAASATDPATTFIVKSLSAGILRDITLKDENGNDLCNDVAANNSTTGNPDCISIKTYNASQLTGMTIMTDAVLQNEERYLYFKIRTKTVSGNNIPVNDALSLVSYIDLGNEPEFVFSPKNLLTNIDTTVGFFQVGAGDVFSRGGNAYSIKSTIPVANDYLINQTGVLFTAHGYSLGSGSISPTEQNVQIADIPNSINYDEWVSTLGAKLVSVDAATLAANSPAGVYLDTGNSALTLSATNWGSPVTNVITILTHNDVYIDNDILINENGLAGLIIMTKGRIGITPRVEQLAGLFFSEQIIDTACDINGFLTDNSCPHSASSQPLTLSGAMAYVGNSNQKGISLDREKTADGSPSEFFTASPALLLAAIRQVGVTPVLWQEIAN